MRRLIAAASVLLETSGPFVSFVPISAQGPDFCGTYTAWE